MLPNTTQLGNIGGISLWQNPIGELSGFVTCHITHCSWKNNLAGKLKKHIPQTRFTIYYLYISDGMHAYNSTQLYF